MKKIAARRKSVGPMFYNIAEHDMTTSPTNGDPSVKARRKSSLHSLLSPSSSSQRRYSIAQFVFGGSSLITSPVASSLNVDTNDDTASEPDYLPSPQSTYFLSSPVEVSNQQSLLNSGEELRIITKTGRRPGSLQCMGRAMRVVVAGSRRVGKTAILRQVACVEDICSSPYNPTIDDTYQVLLEEADRPREILIFHDTGGIADHGPVELKRPYLQVADAFVLVYSVNDHESFNRVDFLKKFIEKQFGKDKKEVPIVVLGNMRDVGGRKVETEFAMAWAVRERVKLFEVSATDRASLVDFVHYLGQRHFHPIKESKFSLSKKLKSEKSNAAILMDF